jgi:ABC-type transporter MlaC component
MYFDILKNKFKKDYENSQINDKKQIEKFKVNLLEYLDSKVPNSMVLVMYWKDGTDENFKYIFEKVFGTEILNHMNVETIK